MGGRETTFQNGSLPFKAGGLEHMYEASTLSLAQMEVAAGKGQLCY